MKTLLTILRTLGRVLPVVACIYMMIGVYGTVPGTGQHTEQMMGVYFWALIIWLELDNNEKK
jgi:hypothetical protein